jgi:3-oxoacyl-[acyl-carrier-protein] synthase III
VVHGHYDLFSHQETRVSFPELYLSKPGISHPKRRFSNAEIIGRVRAQYRGPEAEWSTLQSAIEHIFGLCKSEYRYLEDDDNARVAHYSAEAARQCLEINGASIDEVDLLISGGIARQYFEPATAMEVAELLGVKRTHALDVTAACVGHMEALGAAAGYLATHPRYRTALVCTSELVGNFLSYDIQTVKDLYMKSAGLTVGNGAACFLLRRLPWPGGGIRIMGIETYSAPKHWHLCQAPIDGTFVSSSVELMRLGKLLPPWMREVLTQIGWKAEEVDHFVLHQPSEVIVRKMIEDFGGDPKRGVYSHTEYGNTASASPAMALYQMLGERDVKVGDKFIIGSAAAGFSAVAVLGEWSRG